MFTRSLSSIIDARGQSLMINDAICFAAAAAADDDDNDDEAVVVYLSLIDQSWTWVRFTMTVHPRVGSGPVEGSMWVILDDTEKMHYVGANLG